MKPASGFISRQTWINYMQILNRTSLIWIMLFKKYLKDGMRSEARKTAHTIRRINGPTGDRTYFLYWLTLWFPLNIVKDLIALKELFKKKL